MTAHLPPTTGGSQTAIIGPFTLSFDTAPGQHDDFDGDVFDAYKLADLPEGAVVVSTWAILKNFWDATGASAKADLYLAVGDGSNFTDFRTVAAYAGQSGVYGTHGPVGGISTFYEIENNAPVDFRAIAKATASSSLIANLNWTSDSAFTQGEADVYALLVTPA